MLSIVLLSSGFKKNGVDILITGLLLMGFG
jgi:hypothetical protein